MGWFDSLAGLFGNSGAALAPPEPDPNRLSLTIGRYKLEADLLPLAIFSAVIGFVIILVMWACVGRRREVVYLPADEVGKKIPQASPKVAVTPVASTPVASTSGRVISHLTAGNLANVASPADSLRPPSEAGSDVGTIFSRPVVAISAARAQLEKYLIEDRLRLIDGVRELRTTATGDDPKALNYLLIELVSWTDLTLTNILQKSKGSFSEALLGSLNELAGEDYAVAGQRLTPAELTQVHRISFGTVGTGMYLPNFINAQEERGYCRLLRRQAKEAVTALPAVAETVTMAH